MTVQPEKHIFPDDGSEALRAEIQERKRAEQVARGQTEALARTLDLLAAEPELDSFVGQVLKALTQQLGAQSGSFWLYDSARNTPLLRLDYDHKQDGLAPDAGAEDAPHAHDDGSAARGREGPARSKKLHFYDDIRSAPLEASYRDELLAQGTQTLLVVPLVSGEDLIGSFTLVNTDQRHYGPEETELAQALAQQAVLAIQLTRLAEHRREAAVLEERNRIAREIHDTLAQAFTGILIQLRVALRISDQQPEEARSILEHVSDLAQQGLEAARRSVWDLQPEAMEYRDLVAALTRTVARARTTTSAHVEIRVTGTSRELPPAVGMDMLRIGQEALTNAVRHANAGLISIDLTFETDRVVLIVQDDGDGFDVTSQPESSGFGMVGMAQRAERLGGQLAVASRPGRGTEVAACAPLKPDVPERMVG